MTFGIGMPALFGGAVAIGTGYMASKSAKSSAEQGAQANSEAIAQAQMMMAEAQIQAGEHIAGGMAKAAAATIEAAKIGAQSVMDAAGLAVDAQERFFAIADKKLEPFREQGLISQDEMASMLGIPNADGQLVPYDVDRLRQTPGYEFVFAEGQTAVERSAAGSKLSGAQIKAQTQYGQGLADTYFQRQFGNLSVLQSSGLQAAGQLAQAATNAGSGIGQTYSNMGGQLGNIYSNQGNQLASIATSGAGAMASNAISGATMASNLALAGGANRASLYGAQGQANQGLWNQVGQVAGNIAGSWGNNKNKTYTTGAIAPSSGGIPTFDQAYPHIK